MRKRTRERLSDFGPDEDGKLSYQGEHVRHVGEVPFRTLVTRLWVAAAVAVAAVLVPGFLPVAGLSGTLVVTFAYVVEVVALVSVVWALARLSAAGERVRVYVREETADALGARSVIGVVAAAVAVVGELFLLVTGSVQLAPLELVFLAAEAAFVAALLVLRATAAHFVWESDKS